MKEHIAYLLYRLGKKPKYSTDICGNITKGYGKLDGNGFWEYQIPHKEYSQIEILPFWQYQSIYCSLFTIERVYYRTYEWERISNKAVPKVISATMLLEFPKISRKFFR